MNKVAKVLAYVLAILVLVAVVGVIYKFTAGGTTDFKTFYIECGDETILDNTTKILLPDDKLQIETKYVFADNSPEKHLGYKVSVIPNINEKTNFDFKVDSKNKTFSSVSDVTDAFNIQKTETGFTITNDGLTMQTILERIYKGKRVELTEERDLSIIHFNLIVSSYNEKNSIIIGLYLACPHNNGVTEIEAVAPTCTTPSYTAGKKCNYCAAIIEGTEEIILTHEDIIDLIQEGVDTVALGYSIYIPEEKFGCEQYGFAGFSEGYNCAFCETCLISAGASYTYYTHEEIIDLGLTIKVDEVPATCMSSGYTEGVRCKFCNEFLSGHEMILRYNHSDMLNNGMAQFHAEDLPECYEANVTGYYTCPFCDDVLSENNELKPVMHNTFKSGILNGEYADGYFEKITVYSSTPCLYSGHYEYICPHCGDCFYIEHSDDIILDHEYQTIPGKPATCMSWGHTAYQKCIYCGENVGYENLPTVPHDYSGSVILNGVRYNCCRWCSVVFTDYEGIVTETEEFWYSTYTSTYIYLEYENLTWGDVFKKELRLNVVYIWQNENNEIIYSTLDMIFAPIVSEVDENGKSKTVCMVAGYGVDSYIYYVCVPGSEDENGICDYMEVYDDDPVKGVLYLVRRSR